jgi:hypothetical protein
MGGAESGRDLHFAPTYHIQTPDADSFRRSHKQLTSDAFVQGRKAAAQNA